MPELEKKSEYNGSVHQLFVNFRKAYDSVRREVLYEISIEYGILKKLLRLIKMYMDGISSRVHTLNLLLDPFPVLNSLKQEHALTPMIFNFALEHVIKMVGGNQEGLEINGLHQVIA